MKKSRHFTDKDDEGERTWVKAIAFNTCGGNSTNPKFKIQPLGNGGEDSVANLYQAFKNGNVQFCDVTVNDFIDATIAHLFNDSESGENTWWREEVVVVDVDSDDKKTADFLSLTMNMKVMLKKIF